MKSDREHFLPHLEWEMLDELVTITAVNEDARLPKGHKKITVSRDEDYNLRASMEFKDPHYDLDSLGSDSVEGSFQKLFDIQGSSDSNLLSYTLESIFINRLEKHGIPGSAEFSGSASICLQGLKMGTKNSRESAHLTEWYLNGPTDYVFSRSTDRKVLKTFCRKRLESNNLTFDAIETPGKSSSLETDYIRVKTDDLQFIVGKVPKEFGPAWSSNIAIEYRKAWGRIPDIAEREEILELCSFVFGRQLLLIGYTLYDQHETITEAYARGPWGKSAKSLCAQPDHPPVKISAIPPDGKAERVISEFLPEYRELREPLCLKEALWNYWISREMPLGTDLPILAAAIESIVTGWYRHTKSKSKGLYLSGEEFGKLLGEGIERIKKKMGKTPDADKIIGKISRANEFGMMDNYRKFFEEINLSVTEKEWNALTGRHIFVHGGAIFDKTDWRLVANNVNTFETLFNKVVLKLLEYSGPFIDRSTQGWPEAQLS